MIGEAGSWATVGGLLAVAMAVAATVAAGTVAVGPVRGLVLCLPGILGMAAGGATVLGALDYSALHNLSIYFWFHALFGTGNEGGGRKSREEVDFVR